VVFAVWPLVSGAADDPAPFVVGDGNGTFHHNGLTSTLHWIQRFGPSPPTWSCNKPSRPAATLSSPSLLMKTVVDESGPSLPTKLFLRLVAFPLSGRLVAFRTVPVTDRSACLYVLMNSSRAVDPSSAISFIPCTVDLISCSGHHRHAVITPVSLPSLTILKVSLLEPFTGCISKPILQPDLWAQLMCTILRSARVQILGGAFESYRLRGRQYTPQLHRCSAYKPCIPTRIAPAGSSQHPQQLSSSWDPRT
jgi:hypothetical protein